MFSDEVVTFPETLALKPHFEKPAEAVVSVPVVFLEVLTSLTSIVNLTVVSSMVNAGTGTQDNSGASTTTC